MIKRQMTGLKANLESGKSSIDFLVSRPFPRNAQKIEV